MNEEEWAIFKLQTQRKNTGCKSSKKAALLCDNTVRPQRAVLLFPVLVTWDLEAEVTLAANVGD